MHVAEAWKTYSESFRKFRESSTLSLNKPVSELWLKVAAIMSKVQYKQYTQFNGGKICFVPN